MPLWKQPPTYPRDCLWCVNFDSPKFAHITRNQGLMISYWEGMRYIRSHFYGGGIFCVCCRIGIFFGYVTAFLAQNFRNVPKKPQKPQKASSRKVTGHLHPITALSNHDVTCLCNSTFMHFMPYILGPLWLGDMWYSHSTSDP